MGKSRVMATVRIRVKVRVRVRVRYFFLKKGLN